MSSVISRGLRLALGTLFIFGAAMVVAPAAHAQWTSSDTCVYPTDVPELFFGNFSGYENCEALCKKAASFCEKFVKDGASCWNQNANGLYGIQKSSVCKDLEDPAERKDCNQSSNQGESIMKDIIKDDREDALAACEDYKDSCIMNCSAVE